MPGSGVGHQGRRPGIRNLEKSNGCGEKPDAVGVYFALVCWLVSLFNRYVSNVDRAWQAGLWGLGAQRGSQHSKEPQLRTQQAREAKNGKDDRCQSACRQDSQEEVPRLEGLCSRTTRGTGDCLSREGGTGSEARAEKSSWKRGLGHWQENQCLASPDCCLVPGTLLPLPRIASVPAVDTTLPLLSLKPLCQGRITKK